MAMACASVEMALSLSPSGLCSAHTCRDSLSLSISTPYCSHSRKVNSSAVLRHRLPYAVRSWSVGTSTCTAKHEVVDSTLLHKNSMQCKVSRNTLIILANKGPHSCVIGRFRNGETQAGVVPVSRRRLFSETLEYIPRCELEIAHRHYKSRVGNALYATELRVWGHNSNLLPPLDSYSRVSKPVTWTTAAMGREGLQSLHVSENDLLIVGPGVLGSLVAKFWLEGNEGSRVVGQTNTTVHHEELKSLGIIPVVKGPENEEKFPYVIFCAPPSGSLDYPAEVRAAAQRWNGEGSFLFTSSSALYDVSSNAICDEESAPSVLKGVSPRTDQLLSAEEEVLKIGGNVVRLAGLYTLNRGAHTFYLSKGSYAARPDHMLNLIHYEDAATLCKAILSIDSRGQIYMGCDNFPVTRQELMDAVNRSGKYEQLFKEFTSVDGPLGKKMKNNATRLATGWKPKYESFPSFLGIMANIQHINNSS